MLFCENILSKDYHMLLVFTKEMWQMSVVNQYPQVILKLCRLVKKSANRFVAAHRLSVGIIL